MSWFQSTNLASFAKTALKEAQKTIDKALDISEQEDGGATGENGRAAGGRSNTAVSAAVTDMASEFFASWGVGGGITSPTKTTSSITPDSSSTSGEGTTTADGNSDENRAISTPPKRCATMNDLLLVNHHNNSSGNSNSSSLTSDVPVTLLVSSGTEDQDRVDNVKKDGDCDKSVSSKHTRSLSDTVFHAFDDSNNLGDLVQVLDDPSAVDVASPLDAPLSNPQPYISIAEQQSSSGSSSQLNNAKAPLVNHLSTSFISKSDENVTLPTHAEKDAIIVKDDIKSNVELLQEIDLSGGNLLGETSEENNLESNNVIPLTDHNTVESSGLSDGWDWTSATDSCLAIPDEGDSTKENVVEFSTSMSYPTSTSLEADVLEANVDLLSVSEETLQSEKNDEKSVEDQREQEETIAPCSETLPSDQTPSSPPPPPSSSVSPKPVPCPSSPAPSASAQESGGGGGVESTPPSSARVSPNFEMVSSGCCVVNSGGPGNNLPESSRSSSIVVVSGRESTLNSRGTSGAGSSGSSEGGHDIVDGEGSVPPSHSPAPAAVASNEFAITTKHKKAASSSSSSDIEVIPSDYSSSSSAPLHHPHHTSKLQNISDIACQTDSDLQSTKDCEVQTESIETSVKPVDVDPKELSKYVSSEVADMLAEKEAEVQQLREEGEKLSIKQYELGQVIKKLRAKEKETEGVIKGLRTDVATKNLELEKLMKTFISKEGIEQSQNETISKLNQERRKLELRVEQLNSELEDARDNVESMKATVENASIEILELKNVISSVQRESAEVDRLTRDKGELISRSESLQKEVDHLRSALNSSQTSHHSREAELKSQISSLTQKVHHLETRLADISSEVADATMPLSLEIEKLQGELKQQFMQSDRREQAMHSTIADLELKVKTASDRERSAKELQIQYQSQHSTLELRIQELEAHNRSLMEQLQQKEEIFGKKIEDKSARCQKLEKTVERLTGEVERLCSENDSLSNELKTERSSLEVERRRISQSLLVDARENNNFQGQGIRSGHHPQHQRSSSMSTTTSSTAGHPHQNSQLRNAVRNDNSRDHSPSEHSITSEEASYLDEVFDPNSGMLIGGNNRSMTPKSFFESFSSAGLIENLQSQLRQRESEALAFQEELNKNEKIRKQLNEEIANLTMQNQQLALDMEKLGEMEQRMEELNKNYNAVLQMYGEKVEEADELRMDLEDVKEMYKAQIEQLLKKS